MSGQYKKTNAITNIHWIIIPKCTAPILETLQYTVIVIRRKRRDEKKMQTNGAESQATRYSHYTFEMYNKIGPGRLPQLIPLS